MKKYDPLSCTFFFWRVFFQSNNHRICFPHLHLMLFHYSLKHWSSDFIFLTCHILKFGAGKKFCWVRDSFFKKKGACLFPHCFRKEKNVQGEKRPVNKKFLFIRHLIAVLAKYKRTYTQSLFQSLAWGQAENENSGPAEVYRIVDLVSSRYAKCSKLWYTLANWTIGRYTVSSKKSGFCNKKSTVVLSDLYTENTDLLYSRNQFLNKCLT